jgi:hypothetical protein
MMSQNPQIRTLGATLLRPVQPDDEGPGGGTYKILSGTGSKFGMTLLAMKRTRPTMRMV